MYLDENTLFIVASYLGRETLKLRLVFKGIPFLSRIGDMVNDRRTDVNDPGDLLELAEILGVVHGNIVAVALNNPHLIQKRTACRLNNMYNIYIDGCRWNSYVNRTRYGKRRLGDGTVDIEKMEECADVGLFNGLLFMLCDEEDPPEHLVEQYIRESSVDALRIGLRLFLARDMVLRLLKKVYDPPCIDYYRIMESFRPEYPIANGWLFVPGTTRKQRRGLMKDYLAGRSDHVFRKVAFDDQEWGRDRLAKKTYQKALSSSDNSGDICQRDVDRIIMYGDALDALQCMIKLVNYKNSFSGWARERLLQIFPEINLAQGRITNTARYFSNLIPKP